MNLSESGNKVPRPPSSLRRLGLAERLAGCLFSDARPKGGFETARRNGTTMQDAGEQLCKAYVKTGGGLLESSNR
jgi:hypothetical protein